MSSTLILFPYKQYLTGQLTLLQDHIGAEKEMEYIHLLQELTY
ncbi:hypothetical protein DET52_101716 [Sunxiuqinia elliptica]|uniref:Uncharacterized protein n=1 Tax=Sunxiuqinia elliptica TaxID=655355 RepID=A0A4R6HBL7_9BACT|nr:hypothetical protein DET52_101716 [Sunxiuqinia elliptica]